MSTKRKADSESRTASKPRIMKSGTDSERDSGFSDASSEHMSTMDTTDSEDSPRPFVQQGPQTSGSGPQPSQLTVVGGSYSSISPMIIMNNVLLKQPGDNPPALKPWGFSPTVEVVQPVVRQPQVVFLQPVVSRQTSPASKEPSRHRRPKKYLPILKSYPKIAPHPGDSSSSSGRGTASSSSSTSSSSSVSGSEKGGSSASNNWDHCQREKQLRGPGCRAVNSGTTTPIASSPLSTKSPLFQSRPPLLVTETCTTTVPATEKPLSAVSQSEPVSSPCPTQTSGSRNLTPLGPGSVTEGDSSPAQHDHGTSDADMRRKRFFNTYNILSKSGLLDITLRTKELLRQNRRTQNDLDRLKEHTDLFLQALRSSDSSICMKLHASLQEEDREKEKERAAHASLKAD